MISYTPSYYAATAHPAPERPSLEGATDCDVCVIGAGYSGLIAALELAERGLSVAVVEAARVGWGASGRNGGQVLCGFSTGMTEVRGLVPREDLSRMWRMTLEARRIIAERVERHAIACDLRWGYVYAALKPRQMRELADELAVWRDDLGYAEARMIDRAEIRDLIATDTYVGGLYDAASGHLHPLNHALGLARAAEQAGVRIFENAPAIRLERGHRPAVHTRNGVVRARFVLLCGNAYLGGLVPELKRRIMPVRTFLGATQPLGAARAEGIIRQNVAVADCNFVLNYYRLSSDHRLLFGGGVSYSGLPSPRLAPALRREMLKLFPQLADIEFEHVWDGHVAITMNRLPDFGRVDDRIFYAQGFSGHGVALSHLAGRLMAEAVAGQAGRFDVFARLRHAPFPGGPLRTPALVLAMLYYRLRDLL